MKVLTEHPKFTQAPEEGEESACKRVLEEVAATESWEHLTSHDLRLILLLREDVSVKGCKLSDLDCVHHFFSSEAPEIGLSYRWSARLGQVYQGLEQEFGKKKAVWVDIFFNYQGEGGSEKAKLDFQSILEITKETYLQCETHALLVHEDLAQVLRRGWVLMEIATRAASDRSMVLMIDQTGGFSSTVMCVCILSVSFPKHIFDM